MQVSQALNDVKDLYQKVLGKPAPEIQPDSYISFPPGVDPLNHAITELHELKRLSERVAFAPVPTSWAPFADSFATQDGYVIRMEVPGVSREQLKVLVVGGECIVRGERKQPADTQELRPLTIERPWGPFERRFALPVGSRAESVSARYVDGVLELKIATDGSGTLEETKVNVA